MNSAAHFTYIFSLSRGEAIRVLDLPGEPLPPDGRVAVLTGHVDGEPPAEEARHPAATDRLLATQALHL